MSKRKRKIEVIDTSNMTLDEFDNAIFNKEKAMAKGEGSGTKDKYDGVKKVIFELNLDKKGIKQFSKNLGELIQSSDSLAEELTELIDKINFPMKQNYILWYNAGSDLPYSKTLKRAKKVAKHLSSQLNSKVVAVVLTDDTMTRIEAM